MAKILIVDDEKYFIEMIQYRLEANGYEVVTAYEGKDGLQMVRVHKPDLIILDVLMPVMDGFTCYKELKKNRATMNIPVIILTARGGMEDTFKMAGADAFLTKPVTAEVLLEKVEALLSQQ